VPSRRVNVSFAGQNFGIDLPSIGEGGVEESQSVLAGIFPELKLTAGTKTTRGGRLGRQSLPVTPEVTFKEAAKAPQINVTQTASPVMTQNVGAPTSAPTPAVKISTEYGQSPTFFGHEDYWKNLEKGVSQKDILSYLEQNPNVLQGANVKGKGGLYDQIVGGKVIYPNTAAPAPAPTPAVKISTEYGQSPTFFGHEDYWKNLEKGVSQKEILDYLDRTPDVLQGANVKGKGGLYDQIISGKVIYPGATAPAPAPTPAPTPAPAPAPTPAPTPTPAATPTPAKSLFQEIAEAGGFAAWQKSKFATTPAPSTPASSFARSRFTQNPRFAMGAVSGKTITY